MPRRETSIVQSTPQLGGVDVEGNSLWCFQTDSFQGVFISTTTMFPKDHSLLLRILGLVVLLNHCYGSHVITTPRKWSVGEAAQVCAFVSDATDGENEVAIQVTAEADSTEVLVSGHIIIPQGEKEQCNRLFVPVTLHKKGLMKVSGTLSGKKVDYQKHILFATGIRKTFIQTDKYLYKPGQTVQFRILTVTGPFLKISKESYPLIWVETPSSSRIAQWTNVENSVGLIHHSFKLADEPEQGTYRIKVLAEEGGSSTAKEFKVEEYVLPRFEVTVVPPKYILGTDTEFTFTVCAKYTFGQPVKGNVTLVVENGGWGRSKRKHTVTNKISGCKEIKVLSDDISDSEYYANSLSLTATVIEDGTDEQFRGEAVAAIQRTALEFLYIGKEEYIKPNLPFTGKVKAVFPDKSPAANELMQVCISGECRNMSTSAEGILDFVIPKYLSSTVLITSINYPRVKDSSSRWLSKMYASEYHHRLKKYYSPSNSSLVILVPGNRLYCKVSGHDHDIPVLFAAVNQTRATFTVQVVSRGQIQYSSSAEYELSSGNLPINEDHLVEPLPPPPKHTVTGVINIPIKLPNTASPSAKVIVWYTRPDGEVVSDTQIFDIEKCLDNDVNLVWSAARVQPGEQATLDLSAAPQSICSLGVVDKSVELLSSENDQLTLENVFDIVENSMVKDWELSQADDYKYCKTKFNEDDDRIPAFYMYPMYYSDYVDALKMFDKSGLQVLTDLITETRPCERDISEYYDSPVYEVEDLSEAVSVSLADGSRGTSVSNSEKLQDQRTYFPETWLWKINMLDSSGVLSEQYTLPDTITEWVGKAVCVNSEKGLGISPRATITTFTPFFVDLTLPPTIKRGEILPVKISVFNYLEQALPVKVVLEISPDYDIIEEPESQLPLGHKIACIPPQDKVVHIVKIRSRVLGDVNITVDAFVDELYPEVCGPEYVISKRDILIKPIKVEAEGFPREKTWTKYICSKDIIENADFLEIWKVEPPPLIVEDSARGWVTAVGDLLGPTLENLGSLVKMPYGCGEQNMLNFAPNIFILQYLDASNQTTPAIAKKAVDYMQKGYQRELRYRHDDGSFSAFGNSDASGSTWLTAFVLKSFAQARQYVQVDADDLDMSRGWLKLHQMENGCFQSVGKVFHKGMKGGIDGSGSPVPLTAYVLIALLEAGEVTSSRAVMEAAFCLDADTSKDPYTLALKAYSLSLSDSPKAEQAVQNLINVAEETANSMHWELPAGSGKSQAVAVETAGYAVLSMMTLDATKFELQARKIVKWISSQRNGQGGFISTQDTVVALQALASFEAHQKKEAVNLVITVEGEALEHAFFVDEANKLLQQQVNLPSLPSNVILDMEGEGCALVQTVLRYNVPDATASDAFSLSITTETIPDRKCITKKIKACASYLLSDQKSNMAVMEFNLISGYIPHKADLKQVVGYGTGLIKRYEVDGSKVMFYIDEFSPEDLCVEFRVIREIDVEDAKPGTIKVYDYYQPEFSISKSYVLPPPDECSISLIPIEAIAIEGDIIVEPESGTTTPSSAVEDLVALLDEMP
ncbi:alpha-2-macroglobulin-like isoform X4 [Penaeus chinensis]|uniref:alpha-2-macroglobulin-like isoform X4 n=1 Tax=Penaeus chinensis TaxID=139456 RepID=UPI001FB66B3E|nr:alpha-2-macroglobulin-like isoform X4 [Penaeus chinensis]